MKNTLKIYICFLVILLGGILYIDSNRPKPINWNPTYNVHDKIPFGLYVLDQQKEVLFNELRIENITVTPYEFFDRLYDYDTLVNSYTENGTFLYINELNTIDSESIEEIMNYVSHGNIAFMSTKDIPTRLLDSLGLEQNSHLFFSEKLKNSLVNSNLGKKEYAIDKGASTIYFSKIDTLNTTVLGYQKVKDSSYVNFVKVPYGEGNFYLHTQPAVFTNYYLLKDTNYEYVQKMISYIPNETIFWLNNESSRSKKSQSILRFYLSQPALKWSWYIFLLGTVVFMIFNAKRRQRIIPIIKPLENTTVEFTKTIGNLYFQEGDHSTIIEKKIIYFLEKIRTDYLLDTHILDEQFCKKLQQKSGKKIEDINRVVYLINQHRKSYHQSIESDLITLNNAIEKIIS
jgi:hypothetical protein